MGFWDIFTDNYEREKNKRSDNNMSEEKKVAEVSVKDLNKLKEIGNEKTAITDLVDKLCDRLVENRKRRRDWWEMIYDKHEGGEHKEMRVDFETGELFEVIEEE